MAIKMNETPQIQYVMVPMAVPPPQQNIEPRTKERQATLSVVGAFLGAAVILLRFGTSPEAISTSCSGLENALREKIIEPREFQTSRARA